MKKISMNSVDNAFLLDMVKEGGFVNVPDLVIIKDFSVGVYEANDGTKKPWARLTVVGSDEYKKLLDIGLEDNVTLIPLKIANYNNEDLSSLIGQVIATDNLDMVFLEKFSSINGVAFRSELSSLDLRGTDE